MDISQLVCQSQNTNLTLSGLIKFLTGKNLGKNQYYVSWVTMANTSSEQAEFY